MSIPGCDISGWQPSNVNFGNNQFVYVKATQGLYKVNGNHDAQVAQARSLGLIVGHYHFPAWGNPVAEAQAFWMAANAQAGDFLVLDIEDSEQTPWPADPVSWCCAFEDELYRISGTWAMDYAGPNVRFRPGWDWTPLAQRGGALIDPEYNPVGPGSPAPWAAVAMWQNADTNVTGGDSDIFYGDRAALTAYGIGGTITPQSITPAAAPQEDTLSQAEVVQIQEFINGAQTEIQKSLEVTQQFVKDLLASTAFDVKTFAQKAGQDEGAIIINEVRANAAAVPNAVLNLKFTLTDGTVTNLAGILDAIHAKPATTVANNTPATDPQAVVDAIVNGLNVQISKK